MQRYFARRMVYPWERPAIMRKHIYTGAMGSIYFTLISGIFFVYFARQVGLTRPQMGLMGGVASFLLSAQLLSAPITQRLGGRRKWLWFWAAVIQRALRISGIFLAFLMWHWGVPGAPIVLLLAVWTASFFSALAFPPWMSWLGDIIPRREHGGFWGRRAAWIALSVMLVTIPCGILMDYTPEEHKVAAAMVVFLFAGVLGLLDIVIHGTIPEPRMPLAERASLLPQVLEPIRDRGFRPWLVFNVCWTFGRSLGGSLSWLYFIEELGISRNFLGGTIVITCLALVGGMFTSGWSGRLVDRHGPKRVLRWGHLGWSTLPLFWLLAPRDSIEGTLICLGGASLVGGIACNAAITAANKLIIRYPRSDKVAMYTVVSSCLGSLAGGLGALSAGGVLWLLADCQTQWHGHAIGAFQVIFVASMIMRFSFAAFLTGRVKDPAPEPVEQEVPPEKPPAELLHELD